MRPSPFPFKDLTPNDKRNFLMLILATVVLMLFGLGLVEGAFD